MKKLFATITCSPIGWGALLTIGFYAAMKRGFLADETIVRYTTGHPVEYVTVFMFIVGMISLFFKWTTVQRQHRSLRLGPVFTPVRGEKETLEQVDDYRVALDKATKVRGRSLYLARLGSILDFLKTTNSPDDLDQEMRYQADEALDRSDADYGLVRMFIWAIPILGFLGTVMGITMALGNLNLTELETTGKHLAAGLQVAFDTTALALSLVFVLYFSLFWVRKQETKLYHEIERLVDHEMRGRFVATEGEQKRTELEEMKRLMQCIVDSFEILMKRQTTVWSEAIDHINERSAKIASEGATQVRDGLDTALRQGIEAYVKALSDSQTKLMNETVAPLLQSLERKTERLGAFKDQMIEQSRVLLEVLRATGEITRLEDRLNHNLNMLAGAGRFEETVNSLAATIHLLNGKLYGLPQAHQEIRLAASPEIPESAPANFTQHSGPARVIPLPETDTPANDTPNR
ncbi:MAG: MotA/TolQ/ExbB proton channel family protein [Planctomycetia bacterium]|nr:MotA/TolQ/ExbB proton channel family protein [Planctomycetia bacterium]